MAINTFESDRAAFLSSLGGFLSYPVRADFLEAFREYRRLLAQKRAEEYHERILQKKFLEWQKKRNFRHNLWLRVKSFFAELWRL